MWLLIEVFNAASLLTPKAIRWRGLLAVVCQQDNHHSAEAGNQADSQYISSWISESYCVGEKHQNGGYQHLAGPNYP